MRVAAAFTAVALLASPLQAQVRSDRTWGMSLGLELLSVKYDPRRVVDYAYPGRGWGVAANLGLVYERHFLFGAEVGVAGFGGDRRFDYEHGVWGPFATETTNSLVGSLYIGAITSPIGSSPKLGRKMWAGALLGASRWSGERRIVPDCNCRGTTLHMLGGAYAEPFVVFGGGDRDGGGGFKLAYRRYLQGDATIRETISFGMFFAFAKL